MQGPADMTDEAIARELRAIEARRNVLEKRCAEVGPVWLHEAMETDMALDLLRQKHAVALSRPRLGFFLIEGPHFSHEFDAQPEESDSTPTGAFWYRVHILSDEVAPNQEAPPIIVEEMHVLLWTLKHDDDDQLVAAGYEHHGIIYDTILDLGVQVYGDRDMYDPVEDPARHQALRSAQAEFSALSARKGDLMAEFGTVVNVLIVKGNSHLTPEFVGAVTVPRHIDGFVVSNFIAERVSTISEDTVVLAPDRARIFLLDGPLFQMVRPDTLYADFKTMLLGAGEMPLLQIVEYDRKRFRAERAADAEAEAEEGVQSTRERKRRRTVLEGATPIYDIGLGISADDPRHLSVWMLADNVGLVVVDADKAEPICEHVHGEGIPALCEEQRETGWACYTCYTDSQQRATNAIAPGTFADVG